MTSLVGSSPSSLLRSGSVSAKELESVRRIDCFGEFGIPFRAGKWKNLGLEMAMHWIQSMEKKDSYFALSLGVEEIATSERLRRIAFFPPFTRVRCLRVISGNGARRGEHWIEIS